MLHLNSIFPQMNIRTLDRRGMATLSRVVIDGSDDAGSGGVVQEPRPTTLTPPPPVEELDERFGANGVVPQISDCSVPEADHVDDVAIRTIASTNDIPEQDPDCVRVAPQQKPTREEDATVSTTKLDALLASISFAQAADNRDDDNDAATSEHGGTVPPVASKASDWILSALGRPSNEAEAVEKGEGFQDLPPLCLPEEEPSHGKVTQRKQRGKKSRSRHRQRGSPLVRSMAAESFSVQHRNDIFPPKPYVPPMVASRNIESQESVDNSTTRVGRVNTAEEKLSTRDFFPEDSKPLTQPPTRSESSAAERPIKMTDFVQDFDEEEKEWKLKIDAKVESEAASAGTAVAEGAPSASGDGDGDGDDDSSGSEDSVVSSETPTNVLAFM